MSLKPTTRRNQAVVCTFQSQILNEGTQIDDPVSVRALKLGGEVRHGTGTTLDSMNMLK